MLNETFSVIFKHREDMNFKMALLSKEMAPLTVP